MSITYLIHKKHGWVGVANLPEWINFDEHPPRSFEVRWEGVLTFARSQTNYVVPITKEVANIIMSLNNV